MVFAPRRSSRLASASSPKELLTQTSGPCTTAAGKRASPAPSRSKPARTVANKAKKTNQGSSKTPKGPRKKACDIGREMEPPPRKRARTATTTTEARTRAPALEPIESKAQQTLEKDAPLHKSSDSVVKEAKRRPISAQEDGCLSRLFDLPPELIDEVLSHLHPIDLLHLCRTTKLLRSMLLNRSTAFLWRRCMANVPEHPLNPGVPDVPPKPDDLNEPQWANLLYGKVGCYRCHSHIANFVSWQTNQRLCKKCINARFVAIQQLWGFSIIPYQHMFHREQHAKSILPHYRHLPAVNPFTGCSSWKGRGPPLYCQETASRYEQEWVAQATVPVEKGDAGNQKQDAQKISYVSWKPWVKQKQEQLNALVKHEKLCEDWAVREFERKCDQRERAVIQRLTDLGLGDAVARLPAGELGALRGVRTEHALSEESWLNIKSRIVSYVRRMRDKRLQKEKEGKSNS
ncbi:uncharacterized protein SCHCODRAFT_02608814 [Schizophyllum commune H4-8]|uniref:uncharacterized protein n=1 Tax=Schizophyllum commune (strain H4-8 / FGSC 9210) TaxID=578458 RepID=UPI0021610215|nr:uncharacterized protein SCHCODRAFT_02608814 [Schizophyllum commune H4-8]KAI5900798.1 hypothetical protein SCHCODRAFT_02608814 [Schizophyllum commune H4-8]